MRCKALIPPPIMCIKVRPSSDDNSSNVPQLKWQMKTWYFYKFNHEILVTNAYEIIPDTVKRMTQCVKRH